MYEVNDHLSLVDKDDIFSHMRHSLKIYRSYTDNDVKYKKTDNIYLQDKSLSLIGRMTKYPLILGTKH